MDRSEHKGILLTGGQTEAESTRAVIAALSACTGNDIETTCGLLNRLLQSFDTFVDSLQDALQEIGKLFMDTSDICEPCRNRGTMHGSGTRQEEDREQAKANIKWREKYRPP